MLRKKLHGIVIFSVVHYFPIQTEAVGKLTVRVQTTRNSLPLRFLAADLQTWDSLYIYGTLGPPVTGGCVYYLEL